MGQRKKYPCVIPRVINFLRQQMCTAFKLKVNVSVLRFAPKADMWIEFFFFFLFFIKSNHT